MDVGHGNGSEGGPGGSAEDVICPGTGAAQELLDFGERLLDRIEVGRVRRKVPELGATGLDGGPRPLAMVGAEVIGDDDLAGPEGWREDVADVPLEAVSRHRPIEAHRRADASERQGREDGLVLALVPWRRGVRPLAAWCAGMRRRVAKVTAGLVKPDPGGWIDLRGEPAPCVPQRFLAFARTHRLFFRVHPRAVIARLIVAALTAIPDVSSHQEQCSSSVASAWVVRRAGSAAASP